MNAMDAERSMNTSDVLSDRGLQPERTMLAWRRTCLSYAAISTVAARMAYAELGVLALVCSAVGLCAACAAHLAAGRRYRSRAVQRDGLPLLAALMVSLSLGAMAAAWLSRQVLVVLGRS